MSINLNISPRIIPSIATLYNDTNRIFMEYIYNSIDSAEEFYQEENNSYSKEINIVLRKTKDQVIVEDNCFGITKFEKVVQIFTDDHIKKIDEKVVLKEKEIMTIWTI